ncbi:hypothetical protein GCM10029964_077820 [Kibdelosporangium lantanae]
MLDSAGSKFGYTWRLDGDQLTIWFGDQGSDNFLSAKVDPSGDTISGAWRWPGGGYSATMTRIR